MRANPFKAMVLAFGLLGCAGALPAETSPAAETWADQQIDARLEAGKRLTQQGHPDTAIAEYLDPVIEHYENMYKDETRRVYVAHSQQETFLYLVTAVAGDAGGKVKTKADRAGAVAVYGYWTDALVMKAYALSELRRPDDAKAALVRATALSPGYPPPWIELGFLYSSEKDWARALDAFEHAESGVEMMSDEGGKKLLKGRAWRGKAYIYTEQGKLDDSEALYRKCLALDPDDGAAKRELAYVGQLRAQAKADAPPPATPTK